MLKFFLPFLIIWLISGEVKSTPIQDYTLNMIYQKNTELCVDENFFIEELTFVTTMPLLIFTGAIGIGFIKTAFPGEISNYYNKVHEQICKTKLKKSDIEVLNYVDELIINSVNNVIKLFK